MYLHSNVASRDQQCHPSCITAIHWFNVGTSRNLYSKSRHVSAVMGAARVTEHGDKHGCADVSADANGFTAKHRVPAATPIPSPLFQQAPPSSTTSSALFAPPGKSLASPAGGAGSLFGAFGANVSPDKDPSSSSFAFPTGKETVAATGSAEASSSMFSFGPAASSGASMPLGGGAGHNNTGGVGVAAIAGGLLGNAGGGWGGFGGSTPAFGSGGSTAPLFGGVQSGATAGGRLFGAGASSSSSIFASAGTAQGGTAHRFAALPSEEGVLFSLSAQPSMAAASSCCFDQAGTVS